MIVVHDAARPAPVPDVWQRVARRGGRWCRRRRCPVVPVTDTLREVDGTTVRPDSVRGRADAAGVPGRGAAGGPRARARGHRRCVPGRGGEVAGWWSWTATRRTSRSPRRDDLGPGGAPVPVTSGSARASTSTPSATTRPGRSCSAASPSTASGVWPATATPTSSPTPVTDALLGAAGLGDIGAALPRHRPALRRGRQPRPAAPGGRPMSGPRAGQPGNVDCTVVFEAPKLAPRRAEMQDRLERGRRRPGDREGQARRRARRARPRRGHRLLRGRPRDRPGTRGSPSMTKPRKSGRSPALPKAPTRRSATPGRVPSGDKGRAAPGAPAGKQRGRGGRVSAGAARGAQGYEARGASRRRNGVGGDQVEGRQAVRELLLAGRRKVREIWLLAGRGARRRSSTTSSSWPRPSGCRCGTWPRAKFFAEARCEAPQGVLAKAADAARGRSSTTWPRLGRVAERRSSSPSTASPIPATSVRSCARRSAPASPASSCRGTAPCTSRRRSRRRPPARSSTCPSPSSAGCPPRSSSCVSTGCGWSASTLAGRPGCGTCRRLTDRSASCSGPRARGCRASCDSAATRS